MIRRSIRSTDLKGGDDMLSEQYNRLWWDVWRTHWHNGYNGATIEHGDLIETKEIPGTWLTHAKLDQHVQGDGTSKYPDNPGGTKGVHGLNPFSHVLGIRTQGLLVQYGADRSGPYNDALPPRGYRGRYYYPRPYKAAPFIFITPYWPGLDPDYFYPFYYTVYQSFWSNFTVQLAPTIAFPPGDQPAYAYFFWMALGVEGTPPKDEKKEYDYLL
jgi:hypothetical protein